MNRFIAITRHMDLLLKDRVTFARILMNYCKRRFFKKNILRKVNIALTYDCNANCKHCSSHSLKDEGKKPLSLGEIKGCIEESVRLGVAVFEFTGGEPLLREDIYDAIQFAKSKHAVIGLTTNGLLMNKKRILQLKKAGLDVVQISLDSIFLEKHEKSRGVIGIFDNVFQNIEFIRKHRMKLMLSTIVTPENISDGSVYELLKFIQKEKILLSLNPSCAIGRWKGKSDVMLSEKFI